MAAALNSTPFPSKRLGIKRALRRWFRLFRLIGFNLYEIPATSGLRRALRRGTLTMATFSGPFRHFSVNNLKILGVDLKVIGKPVPLPHVVVANHISFMDILCLGAVVPGYFVAKAQIDRWPFLGSLVRCAGTLYLTRERARHNLNIVERIAAVLRQGSRVLLFPEGTTSDGSTVLRFHSSLLQAACQTGCLVQPVLLFYCDPAAPDRIHPLAGFVGDDNLASNVWRLLACDRVEARLVFLPPIHPGENRHELADAAQKAILAAHPQA